jgi:hypothetical protein
MNLPVWLDPQVGDLAVADPDTGDVVALRDASDRALAHAAQKVADHDRDVLLLKRALAAELRDRYGVGKSDAGGYAWNVVESQTWPLGATTSALDTLVARGTITPGDVTRCMPAKPRPDARQLRALVGRLQAVNPAAAEVLANACTLSPPSLRDVHETAVDAPA